MRGSTAKRRFVCAILCLFLLVPLSALARGVPPPLNEVKETPFSDITPRTPLAEAFAILKVRDIFRGYPDGTAGPNENLNRAQFAAVAVRTLAKHAEAEARAGVQPAAPDGAEVPN